MQPLTRGLGGTWGIGTGWQVRKSDKSNSALELMLCEFVEALTRVSKAQYDKLTGVAAGAVQHAACNTQRATCSVQHAACNTQHRS